MVDIGTKIRNRREQVNMTQQELGEELGVTRQAVNLIEKSGNDIGLKTIKKYAKVLEVQPSYFMENLMVENGLELYLEVFKEYDELNDENKATIRKHIRTLLDKQKDAYMCGEEE